MDTLWPGKWVDSNPYGNRYQLPSGAWAIHTGSDLNLNYPVWNADANAPIYTIADGTIIYAQLVPNSTWGKLVVIKHPDGICSRYGHLRNMFVSAGEAVQKGQKIGTIGGTEYGLPDHLHFDICDSGILEANPKYWPGDNRPAVLEHFVEPKGFIEARRWAIKKPAG